MNRKKLKIVSLLSALTLLVGASAGVNAGAAPQEENRLAAPRIPARVVSSGTVTIEPVTAPRVTSSCI